MIHETRQRDIAKLAGLPALVTALLSGDHCGCQGFEVEVQFGPHKGKALFALNDAFGRGGADEWAILIGGTQVESISVDGDSVTTVGVRLCELAYGDQWALDIPYDIERLNKHPEGTCRLCA